MIPKPPFLKDLTPEQEIAEFQRLKPRLAEVWDALTMREEEPHTAVVVPSLTLDQSELRKISGASFYEERLLFLLIRLRNPRARMVYVTSQPIHPIILEYYLQFLAGIPASHARSRLTLLCADDASPRSLTEKILERPRLVERIRAGIMDPQRAYLTVFNSTPLERKLAVLLGIPLNGCDPQLAQPGHEVGQPQGVPRGRGAAARGLRGPAHDARDRRRRSPSCARAGRGSKRAVVKLDESFSGEGNALFRYPASDSRPALAEALRQVEFAVATETPEAYFDKIAKMGGIVEEFIEAEEKHSPERAAAHRPARRRARRSPPTTRSWAARAARCSWAAASRPATNTELAIQEAGTADRPRAVGARRREPLRRRLPRAPRHERRSPGRRRRSRSTCAWAAPPTPTSRCSS